MTGRENEESFPAAATAPRAKQAGLHVPRAAELAEYASTRARRVAHARSARCSGTLPVFFHPRKPNQQPQRKEVGREGLGLGRGKDASHVPCALRGVRGRVAMCARKRAAVVLAREDLGLGKLGC